MDGYKNQDGASWQPGVIELDVIFTAGSSGAVPSTFSAFTLADGLDATTPMTLSATGVYKCNLADAYVRLLPGSTFQVIQATYDATHACNGDVIVDAVTSGTAPAVTFQAYNNSAGAATAVTASDVVHIHLRLQRMTGDQ